MRRRLGSSLALQGLFAGTPCAIRHVYPIICSGLSNMQQLWRNLWLHPLPLPSAPPPADTEGRCCQDYHTWQHTNTHRCKSLCATNILLQQSRHKQLNRCIALLSHSEDQKAPPACVAACKAVQCGCQQLLSPTADNGYSKRFCSVC